MPTTTTSPTTYEQRLTQGPRGRVYRAGHRRTLEQEQRLHLAMMVDRAPHFAGLRAVPIVLLANVLHCTLLEVYEHACYLERVGVWRSQPLRLTRDLIVLVITDHGETLTIDPEIVIRSAEAYVEWFERRRAPEEAA